MKQIYKEYKQPFLLEETKLTRLMDKIHERCGERSDVTVYDSFEVFLSGNRHEQMTSLDEVLGLENSRKHKIQRLLIKSSTSKNEGAHSGHEIQVDFGKNKNNAQKINSPTLVEVSIRSDDAGWTGRTLSEVEEQVERTRLHHFTPQIILLGLLLCVSSILASQFLSIRFEPNSGEVVRSMWLRGSDLDKVERILNQNHIITDEEMREITTTQLRNVLEEKRFKQQPLKKMQTRQIMFVVVPLVLLLICVGTLLISYPSTVFLWGDEKDRYTAMVQRRKIIWNIIIGVLICGVVGNLISASLIASLPTE